MADDEYEILPHQELEYLRRELERLKKNPFGDTQTGQTLLDSMNNLTLSINKLLDVLTSANDELVRDYHENKTSERLSKMMEQNEKLAQGIVAVGELVKQVLQVEKRNAAMVGGFAELSDFTTDIKKVHTNVHRPTKNPFESPLTPTDVRLDPTQLPRQSFAQLDPLPQQPGAAQQSGAAQQPPPPNLDLPPSFAQQGIVMAPNGTQESGGLPPIGDDDIPLPPSPHAQQYRSRRT